MRLLVCFMVAVSPDDPGLERAAKRGISEEARIGVLE